jgi:hypothetical protein
MQQWEYLIVGPGTTKDNRVVRYLNLTELPNWEEGPPLVEYINQLGADGWELVGTPSGGQNPAWYILIFKRPIV